MRVRRANGLGSEARIPLHLAAPRNGSGGGAGHSGVRQKECQGRPSRLPAGARSTAPHYTYGCDTRSVFSGGTPERVAKPVHHFGEERQMTPRPST